MLHFDVSVCKLMRNDSAFHRTCNSVPMLGRDDVVSHFSNVDRYYIMCTEKCLLLPFGTGIDAGSRMVLFGVEIDVESCWTMACFLLSDIVTSLELLSLGRTTFCFGH